MAYPPSSSVVSKEEQDEWIELLSDLKMSDSRIAFHKLLIQLEKERVSSCRDKSERCTPEVDDTLSETPYTVINVPFP